MSAPYAPQTATATTPDGTPIVVHLSVNQPTQTVSPGIESQVLQPKVAHLDAPQAPLNTATPQAPSETTASLANLTTGLAGMVITAPLAAVEKVSPLLSEKLSSAGSTAAEYASNAATALHGHATNAAASVQGAAQATGDKAADVAGSVTDSAASTARATHDAAVDAAVSAQTTAKHAGEQIPSSLGEAQQQAQGLVAAAASYLPASVQSLLPASITGSHSTLGTAESPLAPYTTPVQDKATDLATSAQQTASNVSSSVQDTAASAQSKVHDTAVRAADVTAPDAGVAPIGHGNDRAEVVGAGTQSHTSGTALDAARVDLDRHRDTATLSNFGDDSKAKSALSNSAFTGPNPSATDAGRQGATDRFASAAKPDSQKTYTEVAVDTVKGKADDVASYLQTDSSKSYTQQASDALSSNKAGSTGLTDTGRQSATDKFGAAVKPDSQKTYTESAADTIKGKADQAASYLQGDSNKSLGQKATDAVTPSNRL